MSKKKSKVRLKKDNLLIFSLTIILIILIVTLIILGKNVLKKNNSSVKETEIVDNIDEYGYYLEDNKTSYYKKLFEELKEILNENSVDDEAYASIIAKLFIADFYDLDSKSNKSEVGGVQYIYSTYQDSFVKKAKSKEGIYYYVKNNLDGNRKQNLPKVKNVEVVSLKNSVFVFEDIKDDNAYIINVNITYEKDLDYQKSSTITLVHNDKKIEIVEIE